MDYITASLAEVQCYARWGGGGADVPGYDLDAEAFSVHVQIPPCPLSISTRMLVGCAVYGWSVQIRDTDTRSGGGGGMRPSNYPASSSRARGTEALDTAPAGVCRYERRVCVGGEGVVGGREGVVAGGW